MKHSEVNSRDSPDSTLHIVAQGEGPEHCTKVRDKNSDRNKETPQPDTDVVQKISGASNMAYQNESQCSKSVAM